MPGTKTLVRELSEHAHFDEPHTMSKRCLFRGKILPNKPPIYVGIYVDDFIYFSADPSVENEFESRLSSVTEFEFMGDVSQLLGIKFTWRRDHERLSAHFCSHRLSITLSKMLALIRTAVQLRKLHTDQAFPLILSRLHQCHLLT